MKESITQEIVRFAAETQFDDLPDEVVHETKRTLLDSIGCAIAGLSVEKGKLALKLARRLGGTPESNIIGTGEKVSCCSASFANGELINALDYDAVLLPGHVSPFVIPAILALAECNETSGRDLIVALALGHEISARVGGALNPIVKMTKEGSEAGKCEWPPVFGYSPCVFGGAAGASKILGLNQEKMTYAMGLAGYLAPGQTMAKWYTSPPAGMTKYLSAGWT